MTKAEAVLRPICPYCKSVMREFTAWRETLDGQELIKGWFCVACGTLTKSARD